MKGNVTAVLSAVAKSEKVTGEAQSVPRPVFSYLCHFQKYSCIETDKQT